MFLKEAALSSHF